MENVAELAVSNSILLTVLDRGLITFWAILYIGPMAPRSRGATLLGSVSVSVVDRTWLPDVEAGLRCSLVGSGLQSDVALTSRSQLLLAELTLVLLCHLRSKRRSIETLVQTLHSCKHIRNTVESSVGSMIF